MILRNWQVACVESIDERSEELAFHTGFVRRLLCNRLQYLLKTTNFVR